MRRGFQSFDTTGFTVDKLGQFNSISVGGSAALSGKVVTPIKSTREGRSRYRSRQRNAYINTQSATSGVLELRRAHSALEANHDTLVLRTEAIDKNQETMSTQIGTLQQETMDQASIPQDQISITYIWLTGLENGKIVPTSRSHETRVLDTDGTVGFSSLTVAVDAFNKSIEDIGVTNIGVLQVFLGPGQTWVVEPDRRNLVGPGCAYSNDMYILSLGRPETQIQSVKIVGTGQGASTIRGSCMLDIYNLQNLGVLNPTPVFDELLGFTPLPDLEGTAGAAQFDLQLLLQNFFWTGWFGVNLRYSSPLQGMITPEPIGYDYYDHTINAYRPDSSQDPLTSLQLQEWRVNKAVEVLMMNVWVQLSDPPITYKPNLMGVDPDNLDGYIPVIANFKLQVPLFFLNVPCLYRMFISSCNWISYDMPTAISDTSTTYGVTGCPPPLVLKNSQFLRTEGVTDTFYQMCSFSCREFGAPLPEFRSIQIWGHAKVSMSNCQFSGRCSIQCNKIAALGCYFLGTGIMPGEEFTTHALVMIPPDWYKDASAKKYGLPSGPRLIISGSQFITHTKQIFTYPEIQSDLTKLPFSWLLWEEPDVKQTLIDRGYGSLNVQFSETSFYMVAPKVPGDYRQGFNFQPLCLTNFPEPQPLSTEGGYIRRL